jgi:pimeloyl-ACP methyl ester carboxylesterase
VHTGFQEIWGFLTDQVYHSLNTLDPFRSREYVILGHSLGAAVGMLCACTLNVNGYKVAHSYGLGSPKVGDDIFVNWVNDNVDHTNFVNGYDIVPALPLKCMSGYRDTDSLVYMKDGFVRVPATYRKNIFMYFKKGLSDHNLTAYRDGVSSILRNI